jgi:GMP synthase PP-ATPase subunit
LRTKGDEGRSAWSGILNEIRAASAQLPEVKPVGVKRDANRVAHILARQAIRLKEYMTMHYSCPGSVRSLVEEEAMNCIPE